ASTYRRLRMPAMLVAGGIVLGSAFGLSCRPAADRTSPVRIRQLTLSGSDSEPASSPDGKSIAFTSRRDGIPRIWWKVLAGGGEAPLTSGPDDGPRFFPDGSSVMFLRSEGTTDAAW